MNNIISPSRMRIDKEKIDQLHTLSRKLITARIGAGLSRGYLADKLNIQPWVLMNWESIQKNEKVYLDDETVEMIKGLTKTLQKIIKKSHLEFLPYRASRGITQKEAGERLGISRMKISEEERKESKVVMEVLNRTAKSQLFWTREAIARKQFFETTKN